MTNRQTIREIKMAIKKFFSKPEKKHWKYDSKTQRYFEVQWGIK